MSVYLLVTLQSPPEMVVLINVLCDRVHSRGPKESELDGSTYGCHTANAIVYYPHSVAIRAVAISTIATGFCHFLTNL